MTIADPEIARGIKDINKFQRQLQREQKIKKFKRTAKDISKKVPPVIELWSWKLYKYLRGKHPIFLTVLNMIFGNIGIVVLSAFLIYYAIIWYPYIDLIYYIIGLITGTTREQFIHTYLIPYGILAIVLTIMFVVLYYAVWSYIFPRLYLIRRDGEQLYIGRAYFYSPESKRVYANLDTFLNIMKPRNSLKIISVENPDTIKRGVGELNVHAEGVKHLHDEYYAFTEEYVPQSEIYDEIIEKHADEAQALLEHSTSRALRYNAEINKAKYKSTIILFPSVMFSKEYRAPENINGLISLLRDRIETYRDVMSQALTDPELQEDLSQKIAPVVKEIYGYTRALEEQMPEFADKNREFEEQVRQFNGTAWGKDDLNFTMPVDLANDYVGEVEAVLKTYEDSGGIE